MITDDELRDLFARRADDVQTTYEIPRALLRRVRRRQRLVGVTAGGGRVPARRWRVAERRTVAWDYEVRSQWYEPTRAYGARRSRCR